MKKTLLLVAAVVIIAAPAMAFHDQGVAHCDGCHTMHNSQDGQLVDPDSPTGNAWLLVDASPSDVCLGCHATGSGAVMAVDVLNPAPELGGGNFIFLLEDNLNDGHGGGDIVGCDLDFDTQATCEAGGGVWSDDLADPIPGDAAGHNVVAPGHGILNDATLFSAPGGTFPSGLMSCTSCHDPHGNQQFRLLYGDRVVQDFYTFTNPAPIAVGLSLRNAEEAVDSHTAYQSGMSAWCGNCHGDFHNNNTDQVHPSGQAMGASIAQAYNLYNGSSDLTGGNAGTAYLPQVPFEDPGALVDSTAGPGASSQVSCITCHRAHATSAADAGRWDFSVTGLEEDGHESGSYKIPNPYDVYQRSLCNKCHVQDVDDALIDFTP